MGYIVEDDKLFIDPSHIKPYKTILNLNLSKMYNDFWAW